MGAGRHGHHRSAEAEPRGKVDTKAVIGPCDKARDTGRAGGRVVLVLLLACW